MVFRKTFGQYRYYDPDRGDFEGFGGGGGSGFASNTGSGSSFQQLLESAIEEPVSASALGHDLADRMNRLVADVLKTEGPSVGGVEPIVETSSNNARNRLAELMASARNNLVATITSNNKVDNTVALVNWRALDLVLTLAEAAAKPKEDFGSLVTEVISTEDARSLNGVVVHHPLPARQSVAERRRVLEETRPEIGRPENRAAAEGESAGWSTWEPDHDPVFLMKVDALDLSLRSAASLKSGNIVYVGDLVQKTEADLLRLPNFGRKSLNEIEEVLSDFGLHLGMQAPGWPELKARLSKIGVSEEEEDVELPLRYEGQN